MSSHTKTCPNDPCKCHAHASLRQSCLPFSLQFRASSEAWRLETWHRLKSPTGFINLPRHNVILNMLTTCMCVLQKVINQFAQLGEDPRVSFFGNVKAGQDVTLSELRALYDGVIPTALSPCLYDPVEGSLQPIWCSIMYQ